MRRIAIGIIAFIIGICFIAGIISLSACSKEPTPAEMTKDQLIVAIEDAQYIKYHASNMAASGRELGWTDEDDLIKDLSARWWEAHNTETECQSKLNEILKQEEANKKQYVGDFKLTGYCPCYNCSEGYGRQTASGATATEGVTIAADRNVLPLGTKVYIEGVGERIVQDVGGAIRQNKIDVYVNNHSDCYKPEYNTTAKVYIIK